MAKSTKYTSKVPKVEEYQAPFITGEGDDREVDVDAAIKLIHTLMLDKAKAQDAREDVLAEKAEVVTERDELQAKVNDKNAPDAQAEIATATDRATKAEERAAKAEARADRLEVVAEKGLSQKQAKYLPKDATREELEEAADEILVDFPEVAAPQAGDEDEDDEGEGIGRQTPRGLINASDPKLNKVETEVDYDKWANELSANRF